MIRRKEKSDWKDLLTAYNGHSITYDAIGNPTRKYKMKKLKHILLISFILLIPLFILIRYLISGMGGTTKTARADFYINGEKLEKPAVVYWLGGINAKSEFPFFCTLEGLGCRVDRDEQLPLSDMNITIGNRKLFYLAAENSLYEEDALLYENIPLQKQSIGGAEIKGQYYLDDRGVLSLLKTLGFNRGFIEIDENTVTVKIDTKSPYELKPGSSKDSKKNVIWVECYDFNQNTSSEFYYYQLAAQGDLIAYACQDRVIVQNTHRENQYRQEIMVFHDPLADVFKPIQSASFNDDLSIITVSYLSGEKPYRYLAKESFQLTFHSGN